MTGHMIKIEKHFYQAAAHTMHQALTSSEFHKYFQLQP